MNRITSLALVAAALVTAPSIAHAAAVVPGFTGGTVVNTDDSFTGPVSLGFTANYFGTSYSTAYLGTNGYITFGGGQSTYTPVGLGAGYSGRPIVAAFYADVDTTEGGTTTYGIGSFGGRDTFGLTYNNVGFFGANNSATNRNTFQILLVNRSDTGAGNFDIVLNYDQILWEAGTSNGGNSTTGRGGIAATVGYNAGQGNAPGTFYEFPGSRTNGAFLDGGANALAEGSNTGVAGRYLFTVRNGLVAPGVPEPTTWAMMIGGMGLAGGALRRRKAATALA